MALAGEYELQICARRKERFQKLYEELAELDEKITDVDARIQIAFQSHPDCREIAAVEGVAPLIATAVVASISNGHAFERRSP